MFIKDQGSNGADTQFCRPQRLGAKHGVKKQDINEDHLQGQCDANGQQQHRVAEPGLRKQRLRFFAHTQRVGHLAERQHGEHHGLPGVVEPVPPSQNQYPVPTEIRPMLRPITRICQAFFFPVSISSLGSYCS